MDANDPPILFQSREK